MRTDCATVRNSTERSKATLLPADIDLSSVIFYIPLQLPRCGRFGYFQLRLALLVPVRLCRHAGRDATLPRAGLRHYESGLS